MALNIYELVTAELSGQTRTSEFVKNVNQVTTSGIWYDLSGSSGNPRAKQWFDASPLVAQQITQSGDGGIFHGSNVSPQTKYLRQLRAGCASATPLPCTFILCDYLLYYPSVEDGNTDLQEMTNTLALPRYTDGANVQMIAVTISSRTGGQSFFVTYTNQDGTSGRTSQTVVQNAVASPGTITTSSTNTNSSGNPFIGLQDLDTGVRSIQSVTMLGADTGFFALILVRPLATIQIRGIDAPYEKDFLLFANELTAIQDNAFLSMLALPVGSLSGLAIRGNLKSVWN
jgi:hypothetical protein